MNRATGQGLLGRRVGLILGPAGFIFLAFFTDLVPGNPMVSRTAGVTWLMAVWWMTEPVHLAVTALIPLVLFPLLGIAEGRAVAGQYTNDIIFLFVGGFMMALAMEKWGLLRRVALWIVGLVGVGPRRILLAFMLASGITSMWISNTATAMIMVPIAMAVIARARQDWPGEEGTRFATALLIGIAYSATIGGLATLIGTPPNLAFKRLYSLQFPDAPEISFFQWMLFGVPMAMVLMAVCWALLVAMFLRRLPKVGDAAAVFRAEYRQLGRMGYAERTVGILFVVLALLWIFRQDIVLGAFTIPGWNNLFPSPKMIDDGTVAMIIALLLFLIPSRGEPGERLLDWRTAVRLQWGVVLLFGGGFALARGMEDSGLSAWLAGQLRALEGVPPLVLVLSICMLVTFLTELVSNTACVQMVLPLLGTLSLAIGVHPLLLMVPATIAASCGFMLPVGTPPNAIVFGTGEVRVRDMIRAGLVMDLLSVLITALLVFALGGAVFGIR
ncbi:MAG TPA: SLC13 family permease [bacterium]|nr:SLC13 family permease [bacterium]